MGNVLARGSGAHENEERNPEKQRASERSSTEVIKGKRQRDESRDEANTRNNVKKLHACVLASNETEMRCSERERT